MPQGIAQSFATPNYSGMLFMKGLGDTPLLSIMGGRRALSKSVKFALGQEYSLNEPQIPNISETASLKAPEPTFATRKAGYNVTQIFMKSFGISDAKRSNMGTLEGINIAGQQANPQDELSFQSGIVTRELARDIEYTFINGTFNEATNDTEVNKTRGLVEAIQSNVMDMADNYISYWDVYELLLAMKRQGADTNGLVLWCDSVVTAQLTVEAEETGCKVVEGNVMGLVVTKLITPAGVITLYTGQFLPVGTALVLNLGLIRSVEQNVPGKGNFYREELAKVGAGTQYQIFGQIGLDYGIEWMHGKITGIKDGYRRPRGKKVFMDGIVETAEVTPVLASVTLGESPVVGQATEAPEVEFDGEPVSPTISYQWLIADSNIGAYAPIDGATNATYIPTEDQVGKYLKVQVTATGTAQGTKLSNAKKVLAAE